MNEEVWFRYKTALLFFVAVVAGFFTISYIDDLLSGSINQELQIATNIGEIERLDEVLTMSARMYTASEDEAYRQRYEINSEKLDAIIADSFKLLDDHEASNFLNKTDAANQSLIKIERQAMDLCKQGKCKQGYDLLHQVEYVAYKAAYKEGLDQELGYLQALSRSLTQNIKTILFLTVSLLIFISIAFIYYHHLQREKKKQHDIENAQHEALLVTMSTVMDTFSNALNNMILFRLKMLESSDFNEKDIQLFDEIIYGAKEKLIAMGSMEQFKSKKSANVNVLDYSSQTDK